MTQPNVTPQEFKYLKEHVTARMIQILAEERGYSLEDAIDLVYTSPIYEKLSDASTGLFFQSPRYVLSYLLKKRDGSFCVQTNTPTVIAVIVIAVIDGVRTRRGFCG